MRTLTNEYFRIKAYIKKAIEEAQAGRTFYEDYFKGKTYKDLSRIDRILYLLLEADCGTGLLEKPDEVKNLKYQLIDQEKLLKYRHFSNITQDRKPLILKDLIEFLEKIEQEKLVYVKIPSGEPNSEFSLMGFDLWTLDNEIQILTFSKQEYTYTVQQLLQEIKSIDSKTVSNLLPKSIIMEGLDLVLLKIEDTEDFVYLEFGRIDNE